MTTNYPNHTMIKELKFVDTKNILSFCLLKALLILRNGCEQDSCFNAFRAVVHGQDNLLNSKLNVRMGKKDDLSNFERGMVVGARWVSLSISQSAHGSSE